MTTHQAEPKVMSVRKTVNGKEYKSCPACSAREGGSVFYPVEEFGERQIAPGEFTVQSWCPACRSGKGSAA